MQNFFSSDLASNQPVATRLISAAWHKQRLAPAYLFTGRANVDKWEIAKQLASQLNCANLSEHGTRACAVAIPSKPEIWCTNCRWINNDEHPQALRTLSSEGSKSGKIPVEKARELCEELTKASHYYRLVVIEEAGQDSFHRPAANALLKTIEEPKPGIVLTFFALNASEVLPTVVSRCQVIQLMALALREDGIWSLNKGVEKGHPLSDEDFADVSDLIKESAAASPKKAGLKSIGLAEKLQDLIVEQELDFDAVIDLVMALELNRARQEIYSSSRSVTYARDLIRLCEQAKTHNKQFVSKKAILESLTFSWKHLRAQLRC